MKIAHSLLSRLVLKKGWPKLHGRIDGLRLDFEAHVDRDVWGIPHIQAVTSHDLFYAQGFVHAQDRLWQMESMRRLTSGRLSEIAGTSTVPLDWFCRMTGMPDLKRRVFEALSDEEHAAMAAYADGVNACIQRMGSRLPLEFSSMKFTPEPWTPMDCASPLPYLTWWLMFWPYAEKLLAVSQLGRITLDQWNDMFPISPGAQIPAEDWFKTAEGLRLGKILPGALAFHAGMTGAHAPPELEKLVLSFANHAAGSNSWTMAKGADGHPLLANDPHLGVSLPAVWYFCHLSTSDGINVAGTSLAGVPGIVIGRNERVAWGLTNVMLDAVDILTYRVSPQDPTLYRVGIHDVRMREAPMVIGLPKGKSISLPLHLTENGPVLTSLEPGVNAVAVLKWYGTLPDGALEDHTFRGLFSFMTSSSASQLLHAAQSWKYASQNFIAADVDGHIGWQACGAAPLRKGYCGRFPADASAGAGWAGFHPDDALPALMDPPEGWIVTANYRPERGPAVPVLSHIWCAPFRDCRLVESLKGMNRPGVDDFRALQMDVHSVQADRIIPALRQFTFEDPLAREAAQMLSEWDREVRADSANAAVFEVFITELTHVVLDAKLGPDIDQYFNARSYGLENEILNRPGSGLWTRSPNLAVSDALARAMAFCELRMGKNTKRWSWGSLHRHEFQHLGAKGRLQEWLLNPQSLPASGDCNTVNVSWALPSSGQYKVTTIPSMRMIVPLADVDGMLIVGPLGQSGQPGHPHYNDMSARWVKGEPIKVPMTRQGVEAVVKDRLLLTT